MPSGRARTGVEDNAGYGNHWGDSLEDRKVFCYDWNTTRYNFFFHCLVSENRWKRVSRRVLGVNITTQSYRSSYRSYSYVFDAFGRSRWLVVEKKFKIWILLMVCCDVKASAIAMQMVMYCHKQRFNDERTARKEWRIRQMMAHGSLTPAQSILDVQCIFS